MKVFGFLLFALLILQIAKGSDTIQTTPSLDTEPPIIEICSFTQNASYDQPIVWHGVPFTPNPPLPAGVCPDSFNTRSCCNLFQVQQLQMNLAFLGQIFQKCSACYNNLVTLWCSYSCSIIQGIAITNTGIDNSTGTPYVTATTTNVHPETALAVYESCKWIETNGVLVKDLYKTYQDFFNFMGSSNPVQTISFQFTETSSMKFDVISCEDQCVCSTCKPACSPLPDLHLNSTVCTWDVAGTEWRCLAFTLVLLYCVVVLLGVIIILVIVMRMRRQTISDAGAIVPEDDETGLDTRNYGFLQRYWLMHGRYVARHPYLVLLASIVFTGICAIGISKIVIEEQPEQLWTPPGSRSEKDKNYFDAHFGPFFRVEQLIITSKIEGQQILTLPILEQILQIQKDVEAIQVTVDGQPTTISDLCFKPIPGHGCLIESVTEFWQNNLTKLQQTTDIPDYVDTCSGATTIPSCMSEIGTPVDPFIVFGGFDTTQKNFINSTALVVTFLLMNPPEKLKYAMAWEKEFLQIASRNYELINIAYSAERSVQDELSRESSTDIPTVVISYVVMFLYVSIALGEIFPWKGFRSLVTRTRFTLGFTGIMVVIFSVAISVGLNSFFGVKATLIISEVIPFLVLAIGVDNVFILVNKHQQLAHLDREERLGHTLADVGSSIALASLSESLAFLLGVLTRMPAVVAFSIYASVAILFDFLLQVTCFACVLALDGERLKQNRVDCIPCIKTDIEEEDKRDSSTSGLINEQPKTQKDSGILRHFVERYYAPVILHPVLKVVIIFLFIGALFVGSNYSTQLPLGLDQRIALPDDSYQIDYFNKLDQYLAEGAPLYLVMREGFDYTDTNIQDTLCSIGGCQPNSLTNNFDRAPYTAGATYSWLDDYLTFAQFPGCCQLDPTTGNRCLGNLTNCVNCFTLVPPKNRPPPDQFIKFLPWFLNSTVDDNCKITGLAYQSDIQFKPGTNEIETTRFRLAHSVLKTQDDYIMALRVAYALADNSKLNIFPYSVFYIFFEQYVYITGVAVTDVMLAITGVFAVTLLLLRNPWLSLLIIATVSMIQIDLMGIMKLWGVSLNAVSVVNMVMAVGIAVEFCVHIAYAFSEASGTKDERAKQALADMGTSVFSGITLTKFLGVVVLGFSSSKIFKIYYFRMYMAIVLLGALHGLMFFPVLLSLVGTPKGRWHPFCPDRARK